MELLSGGYTQEVPIFLECVLENSAGGVVGGDSKE